MADNWKLGIADRYLDVTFEQLAKWLDLPPDKMAVKTVSCDHTDVTRNKFKVWIVVNDDKVIEVDRPARS